MELDQFRIAYRPPYDWKAIIAFLAARATPGVECVESDRYRRTIAIGDRTGTITISPAADGPALLLDVRFPDPRALLTIVERVCRMFDTAADPSVIAEQLSTDSMLRRVLSEHPGIRTPGAWDPFELSVRAILGQQISVAAATTIAGRVAERWGTPLESPLSRVFPSPAQLADAPLEEAGIIGTRAATLRALATAARDGALCFDGVSTDSALRAIPGIGEWTAQYIAMRALNEPDAFPSGDLVLRRMAGDLSSRELDRRSQMWRPWRAYAVMLLWQAARDLDERSRSIRNTRVAAVRPAHRGPGRRFALRNSTVR